MISHQFGDVILQPTTLCNADCDYCYLPHRQVNNLMLPEVAQAVAKAIESQNSAYEVGVVWHGGEPLAAGLNHFRQLVDSFKELESERRIRHYIQTNATLINDQWCKFFQEHNFDVGLSIDGPEVFNAKRVDWSGKPLYQRILKGIATLKLHSISFSAIAVVNTANVHDANAFYQFFVSLGCSSLGINIEEQEGINSEKVDLKRSDVYTFWQDLFNAWKENPVLRVREFDQVLSYANQVLRETLPQANGMLDPIPTIAWNGDVVLLSPELAGYDGGKYNSFVVGNVVQGNLAEIVRQGLSQPYAIDFIEGINACKDICPYYNFCGGGQASNKFFELGTTNATETAFCRNSKQLLVDAVIENI